MGYALHKFAGGKWGLLITIFLGVILFSNKMVAKPGAVPPSSKNTPSFIPVPYVIAEIQKTNIHGEACERYTIILQTKDLPDTSAILRTAQHLWKHRLPRDAKMLDIAVYLPGMLQEDLPAIAMNMTSAGMQTLTYQPWVLKAKKGTRERYGLSIANRKDLFRELVAIDRSVQNRASREHQLTQVRAEYQISEQVQRAITFEGLKNQWAIAQ